LAKLPTRARPAGSPVRLEASGVNPADVGRRGGGYRAMEYPRVVPNSDGAGISAQVGDGVTRLQIGQRVWLFNGQRNGRAFGTAAEYIALAEHLVTPLPENVSFAAGATLGIPGMTPVLPVRRRTGRRPDSAGHAARRGRPLRRAAGEMGRRAR
jgi:NADPH2:quinone reductase